MTIKRGNVLEFFSRKHGLLWRGTVLGSSRIRLHRGFRAAPSDGVCAVNTSGYEPHRKILGVTVLRKYRE